MFINQQRPAFKNQIIPKNSFFKDNPQINSSFISAACLEPFVHGNKSSHKKY
jgi:hypothetical protein